VIGADRVALGGHMDNKFTDSENCDRKAFCSTSLANGSSANRWITSTCAKVFLARPHIVFDDLSGEVVSHGNELAIAPANNKEVRCVALPQFIGTRGLMPPLLLCRHLHKRPRIEKTIVLQNTVYHGLRYREVLLVRYFHRQ
jgi:hypothetical protein